jgi:hypothetical protein
MAEASAGTLKVRSKPGATRRVCQPLTMASRYEVVPGLDMRTWM